jgi:hypothetical protein
MLSLGELQNELAIERAAAGKFSRLLWIPPGLQVEDVRQRKVLEALRMDPRMDKQSDLLETPLEALHTVITATLKKTEAPTPPVPAEQSMPQLYLLYDRRDADVIGPWADWLFTSFEVIHPAFEGGEAEVAAYHEDNLRNCQAALIFYGSAGEPWLRGKLRELQKSAAFRDTGTSPPTGVCLIAPRTPIKERFRTHQATLIPQWDGLAPEELHPFVARVTGTAEASTGNAPDDPK